MSLVALLGVALWNPALSQGHVDLAKAPIGVGLDWFYLPLYPLTDIWGRGGVWAFLGAFSLMIGLMPWLPPLRRARAAEVDLAHCNGCARCAEDCPYEAIRMVRRTDNLPFPTQAQVNAALCTSCGICVGACPSSTPFRRSEELKTGIDLPDFTLKELRERTIAAAKALQGPARVLVFACEYGGGRRLDGAVRLPCVAMAPPSLFDFVLSQDLADGVVIAGCAESACFSRLGAAWTKQRIAGMRDPYLRARVPRERIATIWASAFATRGVIAEIAAFTARITALPRKKLRSPLAPTTALPPNDVPAEVGSAI
jgi:ferredoxin/coenzyme F420-reducing hydrogenase delta subunit